MFNSQFRPPLFPNTFGNMGTVTNFNQFGPPGRQQFGQVPAPPFAFQNQGPMQGNASPGSNQASFMNQTGNDLGSPSSRAGSPTGGSVRRLQQVQHHVQQVPVVRTVQIRERIIEIPQVHVVKEYVPKIELVERVREVPKIEIQIVEKIVEVPQIQYVDKYVDKVETREIERRVPKIEIVEIVREVPKIEYQYVDKIVEVPQIQYIDKVVEVPQTREVIKHVPKIEIVDVPIKREVRVPRIEKKIVEDIQEVLIPEIIEVPIEKEVRVNVPVPRIERIERPVRGPVNIVDVEVEVRVPKHVQVPHYIDVPVPREVIKQVPVPRQIIKYRDVEVPVEVEHIVTVPVERRVPVPRTVYKVVEEIKRVEVPYEVTIPQEVEEIVEVIQQVQPVIEPIVQTRYERLPPIREKGKAVYMNGPNSAAGIAAAAAAATPTSTRLPPLPPSIPRQQMVQAPSSVDQLSPSHPSQAPLPPPAAPQLFQFGLATHTSSGSMSSVPQSVGGNWFSSFANQATPVVAPSLPPPQQAQSPLATAIDLTSVKTSQPRPDSPVPASPIRNQDITHLDEDSFTAASGAIENNKSITNHRFDDFINLMEEKTITREELDGEVNADAAAVGEE